MDKEIFSLINKEKNRQNKGIELIASENYASKDVRKACGSLLTNKYAEGYPSKRYYGGCEVVDKIENLAIERAKELFDAKYANVQPHSGSQANAAAYRALLPNGGKILSLVLNDGGHLTHGSPVSFSSQLYDFSFIDLFSGIGGFHQAMTQLGGHCVLASEIDENCTRVYENNYHMKSAVNIRDLDEKEIPDHDLLCAGFLQTACSL